MDEETEDKYVVVTADQCQPTGDRDEQFKTLEQDLIVQIRVRFCYRPPSISFSLSVLAYVGLAVPTKTHEQRRLTQFCVVLFI